MCDTILLMDHDDHVELLRPAGLSPGASWADLGAGSGAFTFVLRELLGLSADIYAVDRDRSRLADWSVFTRTVLALLTICISSLPISLMIWICRLLLAY